MLTSRLFWKLYLAIFGLAFFATVVTASAAHRWRGGAEMSSSLTWLVIAVLGVAAAAAFGVVCLGANRQAQPRGTCDRRRRLRRAHSRL